MPLRGQDRTILRNLWRAINCCRNEETRTMERCRRLSSFSPREVAFFWFTGKFLQQLQVYMCAHKSAHTLLSCLKNDLSHDRSRKNLKAHFYMTIARARPSHNNHAVFVPRACSRNRRVTPYGRPRARYCPIIGDYECAGCIRTQSPLRHSAVSDADESLYIHIGTSLS